MNREEQIKKNNDAIRQAIKRHGYTLTSIANALGITKSTFNCGLNADMSLTRAQAIANILGITLDQMLGAAPEQQGDIITFKGKRYLIIPIED